MTSSAMYDRLCSEYPEISGPLVKSTIERAELAAAHLGPGVTDRLVTLTRDRLDAIRIRSTAASRVAVGRSTASTNRSWAALHLHARGQRSELDVDLLCHTAGRLLDVAAVVVSVPGHGGALRALGTAGVHARALAESETAHRQGPCSDALASGEVVLAAHLDAWSDERRWSLFIAACHRAAVVTACALPLQVGAARCGVLALYLTDPSRRPTELLRDAKDFADLALELLLVDAPSAPSAVGPPPRPAFLSDHPEVHQAAGMSSVQLGVDLGTAVVRLRERATADGRPLLDLAADVVAGAVRFEHEAV